MMFDREVVGAQGIVGDVISIQEPCDDLLEVRTACVLVSPEQSSGLQQNWVPCTREAGIQGLRNKVCQVCCPG